MLHNFAIFLHPRQKINQCHIYHSSRNYTTIIEYPEQEKENERKLTSQRTLTFKSTYRSKN